MNLPHLLPNTLDQWLIALFVLGHGSAFAGLSQNGKPVASELPKPLLEYSDLPAVNSQRNERSRRVTLMDMALQASAQEGLAAMTELYGKIEPDIIKNGQILQEDHPAALLSKFSTSIDGGGRRDTEMAAFATISATKAFRKNYKHINELARQAHSQKISLRRTALEGLCPQRELPACMPASERYRTHDGTCNNKRRLRWGAAQMPFSRFLPPDYGDGVDSVRNSVEGGPLSSARFVSLLVHGAKDGDAALTLITAHFGQFLDHDMTSTAQPRSINGSVPSCCGGKDFHPSCFPIKVPLDDPWLAPLKVRCLEFLRSAPAQRRDCVLSWREQTNQATSFIDASPIYSNSPKLSDNARVFRNGLLVFGRGNPAEDVCQRGALATQCIRAGDGRSGEQPGLLALHHVWVGEHNRIAIELSERNPHWSDEKIFQETRRIIGAMIQHIAYREFLPIVLGREVCRLFDLELLNSGYYGRYDPKANPTVANSFAAAAFRFGHSLVQNSYMRCDRHHNIISNNVSLHEEFQRGDIGSAGSLNRLLRGMATQRALKRDEFITPELTNHLFQTPGFPFGLDLAAINIQRGRDHGIPSYTSWRVPCGLSSIDSWEDFANVVGPESAKRIRHAYRSVHDIDLFVGGIAERPVVGGLVGPVFACIIAQQFSNSRKGDRFWYENGGFESSFTPAQLHSIRRVSLAQVFCRAVGGGTFQPHIFIPANFPGNERLPCGVAQLAPIDLRPWLEQDPFAAPPQVPTFDSQIPDKVFDIISKDLNKNTLSSAQNTKEDKVGFSNRITASSLPLSQASHTNFIPTASAGFQRPQNVTKINDKLDMKRKPTNPKRPAQNPITGVHNKLDKDGRITSNIKVVNRRRQQLTTRKTIIINNVPVELRSATVADPKKTKTTAGKKTEIKRKNTITEIDGPQARTHDDAPHLETINFVLNTTTETISNTNEADSHSDTANTATEDAFNVRSLLTEPPVETTETTSIAPVITVTTEPNDPISLRDCYVDKDKGKTLRTEGLKYANDTNAVRQKLNRDSNEDIDPLTHSVSADHKRIQRTMDWTNEKNINGQYEITETFNTDKALTTNTPTSNTPTDNAAFRSLRNQTTVTKLPRTANTTSRNVELRQYPTHQIFTKPQKVILDAPNTDEYEIEINIRQTNKSPASRPVSNYPDYTTAYKPYGTDRYSPNFAEYYTTTTPAYGYYQSPQSPPSTASQSLQKTKPPTVIYLNEHDERTTTRQPGLLQNFLSFATNGFSGNRKPLQPNSAQKEKPIYDPNIHENSPHSSNLASSSHFNARPQSQAQLPISSLSYTQVGSYPGAGAVHASSSAVSAGVFGSITGVANSNGGDSTFSFNIRPKPHNTQTFVSAPNSEAGNYGMLPTHKPSYGKPEYGNLAVATPNGEIYYNVPQGENVNSPFSSAHKRPPQSPNYSYYSRIQNSALQKEAANNGPSPNILDSDHYIHDYDYSSRTLESQTNDTDDENNKEDDEYDDYEENVGADKKFNRDGYLRPEHMIGNLFKINDTLNQNKTYTNSTILDDNYVLPVLISTQTVPTEIPTPLAIYSNSTDDATDFPDALAKQSNNDILAEDYNEDFTEPFILSKTAALTTVTRTNVKFAGTTLSNAAFAPINILTKPERPDNWVIFDTFEEKPLLPELPEPSEINADSLHTAEIPMPIQGLSNIWITKNKTRDIIAKLTLKNNNKQHKRTTLNTQKGPTANITIVDETLPEIRTTTFELSRNETEHSTAAQETRVQNTVTKTTTEADVLTPTDETTDQDNTFEIMNDTNTSPDGAAGV